MALCITANMLANRLVSETRHGRAARGPVFFFFVNT
jgi:hypothetical protein